MFFILCTYLFGLGTVLAIYNHIFDGIVLQAVLLTTGIIFAMYVAYTSGAIKVTNKFCSGILIAFGGIWMVYIIDWALLAFGTSVPLLCEFSNFLGNCSSSFFILSIRI